MCKISVAMCKTMNIKSFLVVFLTLFGVLQVYAQSTQNGVVLEYHDKASKTPLSKVAVTASNASSTITDDAGKFTLNFRTLKAGDGIQFRRIEKSGYEVMNREAVEVMRIGSKSNAAPLQIVLCSSVLLNQLRDGYRSVSVKRYETQLKKAEAEAKRLKEAGKLKEEEYNAKLDEIEAEYEEKLSSIDTYIDRFARIDLTELDDIERQIISLVQEGKFDEAMTMYEKQGFVQKLQKSREEQRQLAEAKTKIESAIDAKAEEAEKLRQSIDRQVNLLRMAGGKENHDKVKDILREVFLADESDVNARKEYANALYNDGELSEAYNILCEGLNKENNAYNKALIALDIARIHSVRYELAQCAEYGRMAEELVLPLKDENANVFSRILPAAWQYQFIYYLTDGDMDQCQTIISKIEMDWAPDTTSINSISSYKRLLHLMNDYYSQTSQHKKSLWSVDEEVSLDMKLSSFAPWASTLHRSFATASSIYNLEGKRTEAKSFAIQSFEYATEHISKMPLGTTMIDALDAFYNILDVLTDIEEWDEAQRVIDWLYKYSLFSKLEKYPSPVKYQKEGLIMLSHALVLSHRGMAQEALAMAQEAYATLLKEEDGEGVAEQAKPIVLGRIYLSNSEYIDAEKELSKAIDIAKATYNEEPDSWNADTYCRNLVLYADLMGAMGKKSDCKKYLKTASKYAAFECDKIKINEVKTKYNVK